MRVRLCVIGLLILCAEFALGQTSLHSREVLVAATESIPEPVDLAYALDTFWVVFAACLVFFMQAGFAFLEAGLHSAKNAVHILMKNAGDFLIASIAFWALGFAFMFGEGNGFIGLSGFFLEAGDQAFPSLAWARVPLEAKFFFNLLSQELRQPLFREPLAGAFGLPAI